MGGGGLGSTEPFLPCPLAPPTSLTCRVQTWGQRLQYTEPSLDLNPLGNTHRKWSPEQDTKVTQLPSPRKELNQPAAFSFLGKHRGMTWPNPRGPELSLSLPTQGKKQPEKRGGHLARARPTLVHRRGKVDGTGLLWPPSPQHTPTGRTAWG